MSPEYHGERYGLSHGGGEDLRGRDRRPTRSSGGKTGRVCRQHPPSRRSLSSTSESLTSSTARTLTGLTLAQHPSLTSSVPSLSVVLVHLVRSSRLQLASFPVRLNSTASQVSRHNSSTRGSGVFREDHRAADTHTCQHCSAMQAGVLFVSGLGKRPPAVDGERNV